MELKIFWVQPQGILVAEDWTYDLEIRQNQGCVAKAILQRMAAPIFSKEIVIQWSGGKKIFCGLLQNLPFDFEKKSHILTFCSKTNSTNLPINQALNYSLFEWDPVDGNSVEVPIIETNYQKFPVIRHEEIDYIGDVNLGPPPIDRIEGKFIFKNEEPTEASGKIAITLPSCLDLPAAIDWQDFIDFLEDQDFEVTSERNWPEISLSYNNKTPLVQEDIVELDIRSRSKDFAERSNRTKSYERKIVLDSTNFEETKQEIKNFLENFAKNRILSSQRNLFFNISLPLKEKNLFNTTNFLNINHPSLGNCLTKVVGYKININEINASIGLMLATYFKLTLDYTAHLEDVYLPDKNFISQLIDVENNTWTWSVQPIKKNNSRRRYHKFSMFFNDKN